MRPTGAPGDQQAKKCVRRAPIDRSTRSCNAQSDRLLGNRFSDSRVEMVILDRLLRDLHDACSAFPDKRKGEGEYTMADIGLSAFSLLFM